MDRALPTIATHAGTWKYVILSRGFLPACFTVYMALRAATLLIRPLEQSSDFKWYYDRAVEIVSGTGYAEHGVLTASWPVGWPGFLATLFTLVGTSVLAGQLANLVFSALVFVMTLKLGAFLFNDPVVGRLAVLILTLYPNQLGYVPLLSTEIFYEGILLSGFYLMTQDRAPRTALAGLLFGLATLTKAQSLFIPAVLLLSRLIATLSLESVKKTIRSGLLIYATAFLVIAPWTYRNYQVFYAFIPVSTNGGWTLLTGNNPEANGDYTPDTVLAEGINHDPSQQVEMDHLARARAVDWIKDNPIRFLSLAPLKMLHLWGWDGESEWFYQRGFADYDSNRLVFRSIRALNQAYYFAIIMLALPSIWLLGSKRSSIADWKAAGLWICVYFSLISVVFSGQSRFHLSLMPFLALYAAWTLSRVLLTRTPGIRAGGPAFVQE